MIFQSFFVTGRNQDPTIHSTHSLSINKMSGGLHGKKYAAWSLPSSPAGVTGHRPAGLLSHCYTTIQGSRCWHRLLDTACFLAKAVGSAPAGSPFLPDPGPYLDPMQKDLIRLATRCGVQHQVFLATSLAPGLITGLLLVSTSPLLEHSNSYSALISCIFPILL